ncbi:hypothetical protein B0H13DRAFT_1855403 [Mycena leptocephala]|nr:hypothetical protein B0H13DRAFT_1855403 [Mycena leptocephala]
MDNGPAIWLAGELVLCVVGLINWASNLGFDDLPPPIAIHKSHLNTGAESRAPIPSTDRSAVTYDIGWMLDDAIVEDLRAVIVGIDKYEQGKSMSPLKGAVMDASSVSRYLQDDLGVAESHINYMANDEATTLNINKTHSTRNTDNHLFACYLARDTTSSIPVLTAYDYHPSTKEGGIPYSDFLHVIQTILASKGNYISCQTSSSAIPPTCCSAREFAREGKNGGIFTAALLQELRGPEHRASETDGDEH